VSDVFRIRREPANCKSYIISPTTTGQGVEEGIQTTQNSTDYTMLNQYLIRGNGIKKDDQICSEGESGSLLSWARYVIIGIPYYSNTSRLSEGRDHFITSPVGFLVSMYYYVIHYLVCD
jgi:hypothetical protein